MCNIYAFVHAGHDARAAKNQQPGKFQRKPAALVTNTGTGVAHPARSTPGTGVLFRAEFFAPAVML